MYLKSTQIYLNVGGQIEFWNFSKLNRKLTVICFGYIIIIPLIENRLNSLRAVMNRVKLPLLVC